jgi:hypothetical protein
MGLSERAALDLSRMSPSSNVEEKRLLFSCVRQKELLSIFLESVSVLKFQAGKAPTQLRPSERATLDLSRICLRPQTSSRKGSYSVWSTRKSYSPSLQEAQNMRKLPSHIPDD